MMCTTAKFWKMSGGRRGLTLVEVVVAILVAAFVAVGFMASLILSMRRLSNTQELQYAMQVMNIVQNQISACEFNVLGEPNVAANRFEARFNQPITMLGDPTFPGAAPEFRVNVEFTGWGGVSSSSSTSLTANFRSNQSPWTRDEWVGSFVTITGGLGSGQIMRITGNTENTLTVTSDLTGTGAAGGWALPLGSSSEFQINGGKTVRVTVTWGDGENWRRLDRTLLRARPIFL